MLVKGTSFMVEWNKAEIKVRLCIVLLRSYKVSQANVGVEGSTV